MRCAAIEEVVEAAPQGFAIDRHMTPTLDFGSITSDGGMAADTASTEAGSSCRRIPRIVV